MICIVHFIVQDVILCMLICMYIHVCMNIYSAACIYIYVCMNIYSAAIYI